MNIFNFLYNSIGGGSPVWQKKSAKFSLKVLRYIILFICIGILIIVVYYAFLGFSQGGLNEEYTPGEFYPY